MLNYKIDDEIGIIYVKPQGNFKLDDILTHVNELAVDPDFRLGVNAFYNFTEVDQVDGDLSCLMQVASRMEDHQVISKASNVSIVVNNENLYRIFKGYCLMASSSLVKYKIFWQQEFEQALSFVDIKELPSLESCLEATA